MKDEEEAAAGDEASAPDGLPVIAIGASAGGLEPLASLLATVPAGTPAAYVVIQHLAPDQRSVLHEILDGRCALPVAQMRQGETMRPGHVYVVPPGKAAELAGDALRLSDRPAADGLFRPIDGFFESLADQKGRDGYCVVLSGTGSDGSAGLRAVKAAGGFAVVQESGGARFPGMPDAAVATGLVDFVLPAGEIATRLEQIIHHRRSPADEQARARMRSGIERALPRIAAQLRRVTGHDFSDYKPGTLVRRIERRMMLMRISDVERFAAILEEEEDEAALLGQEFLIGVTEFFRDPDAFEALRCEVVEPLLAGDGSGIRVWVPGCSTGEEVYSIAILFLEAMEARGDRRSLQIFGTDIDTHALLAARGGLYGAAAVKGLSEARRERFFRVENGQYRARSALREACVFAPHNLVQDPPFSRLDLISCRNVLIYLSTDLQRRVLPRFHFSLRQGGFLFLGPSEGVGGDERLFDAVDKTQRVFRRNDAAEAGYSSLADPLPRHRDAPIAARRGLGGHGPDGAAPIASREVIAEREFLRRHAAPFTVVSRAGEVRYLSQRMTALVRPAAGAPTNLIDGLLAVELRVPVRSAVAEADERGETAHVAGVLMRGEGGESARMFDVSVSPMAGDEFLVVLSEVRATDVAGIDDAVNRRGEADRHILEHENVHLRRQLAETLQEYETSGQELKSTNEELMSMNEELQSSNEELETSREELQSINEELETVNAELRENNRQLQRANSDLKNLFESTDVAVLFLDRTLCVRNFTPPTAKLFGVRRRDIGRPIHDLSSRLGYPELAEDAKAVDATLQPLDREVGVAATGETFMLRMKPYRTTDDRIDGYVLSFVDITSRKRTEEVLERNRRDLAEQYAELENLYDTTPVGLALMDRELRWTRINEMMATINGFPVDAHLDVPMEELLPTVHESLGGRYREVFETGQPSLGNEVHATLPKTGAALRDFIADLYPVWVDGHVHAVGACVREVTEQTQMIARIEEQNDKQRLLLGELQHRVKNTLATVRAISKMLLGGAVDAPVYQARLADRLEAIARTHDLLTDADWSTANLRDILAAEAGPYRREDGDRMRIAGPALPLTSKEALAFGMAVHELTTNAAKYGALSVPEGRVEVRMEDRGAAGRRLVWTERGGPPVEDPGSRRGFGFTVIDRVLVADVGASVETKYNPDGLRFEASF